jgi:hypothetical protein
MARGIFPAVIEKIGTIVPASRGSTSRLPKRNGDRDMRRGWMVGVALAVLLGALLRLACLGAEFWLDEIWSFELAHAASSPVAVLFGTRHDNNHHLNTLWLGLWPAGVWWGWYRLHSLAAGLASIVLAAKVGRRLGQVEAVVAAVLVASCSWLVIAGAEARGYALAVCFALLGLDALWSYLDGGRSLDGGGPAKPQAAEVGRPPYPLVVFWVAAILGFLSHLTFVHAYLGFVVWSLRRFGRERSSSGDEVRRLAVLHGVPAAFFAVLYLGSVRGMEVGGGPIEPTHEVLARLIGLGLGGPAGGWVVLPIAAIAFALFAGGLWLLARQQRDVWVFFLVTAFAAPALILARRAMVAQSFLAERYFFIPLVFFLLCAAFALAELLRRNGASRAAALVLLGLFVAGNVWTVRDFAVTGRGDFHEALAWVIKQDKDEVVRVTSDKQKGSAFRTEKYVLFYAPYLSDGREIAFVPADAPWLLVHLLDNRKPPLEQSDEDGNTYRLERSYPSHGPWAWGWFVYRRVQ